jgi:hypothetical protein
VDECEYYDSTDRTGLIMEIETRRRRISGTIKITGGQNCVDMSIEKNALANIIVDFYDH